MSTRTLAYSEQVAAIAQPLHAVSTMISTEKPGLVDSLQHPLAVLIRQVLSRQGRQELNLILIDDEENLIQALDAGVQIHSVYFSGSEVLSEKLMKKLPRGIPVYEVARRTCKKLFENDRISRIFAIARTPASQHLGSLLEDVRDIVALEDLTISGNIGAIVRTCVAFGIGGIVLLNTEPVDVYDRRIIRASRGHIFSLPVVTATTEELIRFCRQNDLPVLIMSAQADRWVGEAAAFPGPFAIAFGSEKDGCSQLLMNAAAMQVQIPTDARVESLNVSTTAGIMLYNRLWFNHPEARK